MTSTFANGGTLYKPLLIKDAQPVIAGKAKMKPETFALVKRGLWGVVNEPSGTGWLAKSYLTTVAGKTGTAQVIAMKSGYRPLAEKYQDHAWFVAFAPVEKPEIAMAVLVEHGGHGGGAAAPIAKTAIESYIKLLKAPPKINTDKPDQSTTEAPPVSND
jgi:penicillin-binding protein 2